MKNPILPRAFAELLRRFLQGKATPREQKHVNQWIDSIDENKGLPLTPAEEERVRREIWHTLEKRTNNRGFFGAPLQVTLSIAASLTLIVIVSVFYQQRSTANAEQMTAVSSEETKQQNRTAFANYAENQTSIPKTITLPDGSQITLQPGSEITYNNMVSESRRLLSLRGKAFFDVAHDKTKPFLIHTGKVTTMVLGTSFTIDASGHNNDVKVSVKTGKVSVSAQHNEQDKKEVVLLPNHQVVFNDETEELLTSLVEEPKVVKREFERVVFDAVALAEILISLEKSYGIDMVYDEKAISNCRMTTTFDEESLYDRLDIISKLTGATYTVEGLTIHFETTGCNTTPIEPN